MRKLFTGLVTAALILSCMTVSASARHGCRAMDTVCGGFRIGCGPAACVDLESVRCHSCVDEDGDGVCDNYDPDRCPGNGMGCGNGGYVDADNDGVCDNYDPEYCPGDGTGNGGGNGYGCGSGMGYGNGGYGGGHHGGGGPHGGRHC